MSRQALTAILLYHELLAYFWLIGATNECMEE
jgi:hypothetical protein